MNHPLSAEKGSRTHPSPHPLPATRARTDAGKVSVVFLRARREPRFSCPLQPQERADELILTLPLQLQDSYCSRGQLGVRPPLPSPRGSSHQVREEGGAAQGVSRGQETALSGLKALSGFSLCGFSLSQSWPPPHMLPVLGGLGAGSAGAIQAPDQPISKQSKAALKHKFTGWGGREAALVGCPL